MGVDRLFASERDQGWAPRRKKRVVWWLIGVNIGVFLLVALIRGSLSPSAKMEFSRFVMEWLAVSPNGLLGGRVWELLTYQFLHAGGMHLAFNMLVLYFLGTLYEDFYGARQLVRVFLLCGAFAGLACFLEGRPVVGASASILALLMVLAVRMPNQIVLLFFFRVRMKWVAAIVVGLDLLFALSPGRGDGAAHLTHLAGALAGAGYAWFWPRVVEPRLQEVTARMRRKREVDRMERQLAEERELDRILDKISREGLQSLSEEERRFLARTSRKLQDSKRS